MFVLLSSEVCVADSVISCCCVQALSNQIKKYYGNITAENTIYGITSIVQTGDVHAVVYDLTDQV